MLTAAPSIEACYDFSPIETAVGTLANQAQPGIKWLTPFDANQLQKARPRVESYIDTFNEFGSPPHYVNTAADGARRINGWLGSLRTMIITETVPGTDENNSGLLSYQLHEQYRAFVLNILATVDQQLRDNPVLLPYHQIARMWGGSSVKYKPDEGVYISQFTQQFIFSIRPSAYPGGLLNAGQIPT
jgi:tRNA G26 N,N-dimethylase Trm1